MLSVNVSAAAARFSCRCAIDEVPGIRRMLGARRAADVFSLGNRTVNRMGYGAMQLAGPSVFGPPKDRHAALAVLREAGRAGRQPHRYQ
jgi:hypothetical protein